MEYFARKIFLSNILRGSGQAGALQNPDSRDFTKIDP
jgi:hypothetical protein